MQLHARETRTSIDPNNITTILRAIHDSKLKEIAVYVEQMFVLLNQESLQLLNKYFTSQPPLTTLIIHNNYLGDTAAFNMLVSLKMTETLQTLKLIQVGMGNLGAKAVAHFLMINQTAEWLDLSLNDLMDEGVAALLESLETNCSVKHLDLGMMGMTDAIQPALASCLKKNKSLKTLSIGNEDLHTIDMELWKG